MLEPNHRSSQAANVQLGKHGGLDGLIPNHCRKPVKPHWFHSAFFRHELEQEALAKQAIFKTNTDPEPFDENSHAAGRPETITSDDRNGFSMRESLVLGSHR